MGLLGVARANTAVGVRPETFLLLLLQQPGVLLSETDHTWAGREKLEIEYISQ
jgi:hypothetical protein